VCAGVVDGGDDGVGAVDARLAEHLFAASVAADNERES